MAPPIKPVRQDKKSAATPQSSYSFGKQNYRLMIIGLVIIAIGFFLMSGSEDIFNTTKMTVAPILVVFGFAFEVYAILKKPESSSQ
jgi:hypothetical protein